MSTRTISYHTLVCDGCAEWFGRDVLYASAVEVRAAAFSEGWRFPEKFKANGESSKTVNDVCPKCAPEWQRRPATNNWAISRERRPATR